MVVVYEEEYAGKPQTTQMPRAKPKSKHDKKKTKEKRTEERKA
jgi:hypothetical protein